MPMFDAVCPSCGWKDEVFVFSPGTKLICPECHAPADKIFGTFAIRCSPRIPKNHLPKEKGGDFDPKDAYWQGTESRYR